MRGVGAVLYGCSDLDSGTIKVRMATAHAFQSHCAAGVLCASCPDAQVSLRSLKDEDVRPVAEQFGGGGHQNACSFNVERAVFEAWKV
jgi:nanoRNase/pAp phosphatase (c-di-AMP/oligoRNAs hydrolase)